MAQPSKGEGCGCGWYAVIFICIFFIYFLFPLGRNPNAPYEVVQLFGAGNQVDGIKQWDSYEVESQKYLQIGERAQ